MSDKLVRKHQNTEPTALGTRDPVNKSLLKCFPIRKYFRWVLNSVCLMWALALGGRLQSANAMESVFTLNRCTMANQVSAISRVQSRLLLK